MSLRGLRGAEILAALAAAGLLVSLFLDWFGIALPLRGIAGVSGWDSLGWFLLAVLVLSIVLALGLALAFVLGLGDEWNLRIGVALAVVAPVAFIVLLVVTLAKPGLGAGLPNSVVAIQPAAVFGVVCAGALAVGGLLSLRDERTSGPERTFTAPARRPAPPPTQ